MGGFVRVLDGQVNGEANTFRSFGCFALCGVWAEQEACREAAAAAVQGSEGDGRRSSLPMRWWQHASLPGSEGRVLTEAKRPVSDCSSL